MSWIKESNRWRHFLYAIPLALVLTVFSAIGCAGGMEFKDLQYGNRWDWLDFLATVLGGIVGQALQVLIIYLIIKQQQP